MLARARETEHRPLEQDFALVLLGVDQHEPATAASDDLAAQALDGDDRPDLAAIEREHRHEAALAQLQHLDPVGTEEHDTIARDVETAPARQIPLAPVGAEQDRLLRIAEIEHLEIAIREQDDGAAPRDRQRRDRLLERALRAHGDARAPGRDGTKNEAQ